MLSLFKKFNVEVHLMGMQPENLTGGKKYKGLFDIVVLGFIHSAYLSRDVQSLVKKGGFLLT
jgi:hypothetical protein